MSGSSREATEERSPLPRAGDTPSLTPSAPPAAPMPLSASAGVAPAPPGAPPLPMEPGAPVRMEVGSAEDPVERDADDRADHALARLAGDASALACARVGGDREERTDRHLRRSSTQAAPDGVVGRDGGVLPTEPAEALERLRGSGRPLDEPVRQRMERGFGASFSEVRIHDGPEAARLNRLVSARAFTTGRDIFFGADGYDPQSAEGERVLAHELAHTLERPDALARLVRRKIGPDAEVGDSVIRVEDKQRFTVLRKKRGAKGTTYRLNPGRMFVKANDPAYDIVSSTGITTSPAERQELPEHHELPDEAAERRAPISGAYNLNNDCFLHAACHVLARSYLGVLPTAEERLHAFLEQHGDVAPDAVAMLGDQLAIKGVNLDQLGRDAHERQQLRELQLLVVLRRFLARLNDDGAPIPAADTEHLRALLMRAGIVITESGMEDAATVVSGIVDHFTRGAAHKLRVSERIQITGYQTAEQLPSARSPEAAGVLNYVPPVQAEHEPVAPPERTIVGDEDAIVVSLALGYPGLIEWLRAMYGDGILEQFDSAPHRRNHEWANVPGPEQPVAVTERRMSRKFVALPPVLTIVLRRAAAINGVKDNRAFHMPEQLSLVQHPTDGGPVTRHYRLQAVVYHQGPNANTGHYWAHRHEDSGWHRANNSVVSEDAQAQNDQPVEGELEHDVDHGYMYTYREVLAPAEADSVAPQHGGVALDRDQLPAHTPPPYPVQRPRELATEHELDRIPDIGALPRKTQHVRGAGKVRAMPVPGRLDVIEKTVAVGDRKALNAAIDDLVDEHLPQILWAYTIEIRRKGADDPAHVPLLDIAPALRLLEQFVAWWIAFNPSLMNRPLDEILPKLRAYVGELVQSLVEERGSFSIGTVEEDEDGHGGGAPTPRGAAKEPEKVEAKPEATPEPKRPRSKSGSDPGTLKVVTVPSWLTSGPATHVKTLLDAKIGTPAGERLCVILENQNKSTGQLAALLGKLIEAGKLDEAKRTEALGKLKRPTSRPEVLVLARELGLYDPFSAEAIDKFDPQPEKSDGDAPVDATVTKGKKSNAPVAPPLKAEQVLASAQQSGWITKRETDASIAAMGERAFVGAMARNRDKEKLSKVRALIEQLARVPKPGEDQATKAPPLTAHSLILDTNLIDVLVLPLSSLSPKDVKFRATLLELIDEFKINDLRLANINIAEANEHGDLVGTVLNIDGRVLPWYGLPLEKGAQKRTGDYNELFKALEAENVGEAKGNEDRSMVADAFFAETDGSVAQFATADKKIYNALMRMTSTTASGTPLAQALDPAALDRAGSREEMLAQLQKQTNARFFTPAVLERRLVVHPLSKPVDVVDETRPTTGKKSLDPREAPCGPFQVGDLMNLIKGAGYDAMIVGGGVRDTLAEQMPKDVDIKTNMPMGKLDTLLAGNPDWADVPRPRKSDMNLVKVGYANSLVDVSCASDDPAADKPGKLDVMADALTRDFRMNAVYLEVDGTIRDPLGGRSDMPMTKKEVEEAEATRSKSRRPGGTLRFAVDPGPKDPDHPNDDAEARVARVVKFLKGEPQSLGRSLKFITRGYEMEPEILDGIRSHSVEILMSIEDQDRAVKLRALLLYKTDIETPEELVALMRRFQFPAEAIRLILPDSVAGQFDQVNAAHDRDVMPRNRGLPDAPHALGDLLPALKVDTAQGRIYQYRVEVKAPKLDVEQEDEQILIDIDATNHDVAGHPSPHYHIYRWFGAERGWDKKQSGLSPTGQPGLPAIDGGVYRGPQPWRWVSDKSGEGSDPLLAQVQEVAKRANVPLSVDGEVFDVAGHTRVHRLLMKQILDRGRLHELFLVVRNLMDGIELDGDDPQVQDLIGTKQGQFRMRFSQQLAHVGPFLGSCGIPEDTELFQLLDRRAQLRLFDLANANVPESARPVAAAWALENATTVDEFVQRFEFHLATLDQGKGKTPHEMNEQWKRAIEGVRKAGAVTPHGTVIGTDDLVPAVKAVAEQLGFDSESTAAYHLQKHVEELKTPPGDDLTAAALEYVGMARKGIANAPVDKVEISGEESGETTLVFWDDSRKIVVRVKERSAFLITFFTKSGGNRGAPKRTIRQAVIEPPPPDQRQLRIQQLKTEIKPTRKRQENAPPDAGVGYMLRGYPLTRAGAVSRGLPNLIDGADDDLAITEESGVFTWHLLATYGLPKGGNEEPLADEQVLPVRFDD